MHNNNRAIAIFEVPHFFLLYVTSIFREYVIILVYVRLFSKGVCVAIRGAKTYIQKGDEILVFN